MTLQASGAISLNNVNVELGVSGTTTRTMNDSALRSLFGVASGTISMSSGYGKSSFTASYTIGAETSSGPASNRSYHRTLTASAVGGTGSYAYAWSIISSSDAIATLAGATSASATLDTPGGSSTLTLGTDSVTIRLVVTSGSSITIDQSTTISYYF